MVYTFIGGKCYLNSNGHAALCSTPFFFLIKNADVYKQVLFLYVFCNYCFSVSSLSIEFPVEVNYLFIYSAQKSVMPSKWFMIFHIIFQGPLMMCATKKTDNRI